MEKPGCSLNHPGYFGASSLIDKIYTLVNPCQGPLALTYLVPSKNQATISVGLPVRSMTDTTLPLQVCPMRVKWACLPNHLSLKLPPCWDIFLPPC